MNTYPVPYSFIETMKAEGSFQTLKDAIVLEDDKGVTFDMSHPAWKATRQRLGHPILGYRGQKSPVTHKRAICLGCMDPQCPNIIDGCCGSKAIEIKYPCMRSKWRADSA